MQRKDFIIVGQGIAGTLLAEALLRRGCSVILFDGRPEIPAASEYAGGILHAGVGKDLSIDPFLKQCLGVSISTYRSLEGRYQTECFTEQSMLLFKEGHGLAVVDEGLQQRLQHLFHTIHPPTLFQPVFQLDVVRFLLAARQCLIHEHVLQEEVLDPEKLDVGNDGVAYSKFEAERIIFCEGVSAMRSRYFGRLPFIKNRGDVLQLHIPDLPSGYVYEKEVRLVARANATWWCGSNHQWVYNHLNPDTTWREHVLHQLKGWLKVPFEITDHTVAERPTTAGQFPLIGMHPAYHRVGILNGLGTRGLTLAQWYAEHFAALLCGEIHEIPGYNHARFLKALQDS
ncbi:MAG TPA: FAD-dependent oxidoreductase [Ferruginibacter sp.]|nr:FAD-dependent oxidoreductase [Ferruginibacter sp.]HRO17833.1 FAD-dependent oxidoreductase [Ferruginibacter sp.]HRQ19762.1 FAD-dependent oxidoreductase [Ferruginibacter sp.]